MSFLFWIIFGLITGTVANIIDPHPARGGWLGALVLGVLGALLLLFIGRAFGRA